MAEVGMSYEVDVVARDSVVDGIDAVTDCETSIVPVPWFLEVHRPGIVVQFVGDRFRVVVVTVCAHSSQSVHRLMGIVPSLTQWELSPLTRSDTAEDIRHKAHVH